MTTAIKEEMYMKSDGNELANAPVDIREVYVALEELDKNIDHLNELVEELSVRLIPICRDIIDPEDKQAIAMSNYNAPFSRQIQECTLRVLNARENLSKVIHELEI